MAIDLFCGLGGWAEGFLAEGYNVIGFDIERRSYPGKLVLQDVLTLHGSQFRNATAIVASPPCQAYSYRAMPWKRAKALPPPDNSLFDACFRIQREACEAAGRYIPMVVENVKGAQKWVGSARWHYGSFYLWGDVPALMPFAMGKKGLKVQTTNGIRVPAGTGKSSWFFGNTKHEHRADPRDIRRDETGDWVFLDGTKLVDGFKGRCGSWFARNHIADSGSLGNPDGRYDGIKFGGGWWHDSTNNLIRKASSRSAARKAASALIAKIPFPLANHIAKCFKDEGVL